MRINVEIGFPEVCLCTGVFSTVYGSFTLGIILCVLSFIGTLSRTGLRLQKQQQEEADRRKLLEELHNAGEEFAESVVQLFGKNPPKKTVH